MAKWWTGWSTSALNNTGVIDGLTYIHRRGAQSANATTSRSGTSYEALSSRRSISSSSR